MKQLESIRGKFDSFMAQAKSDPTSGADILKEAHNQVEGALKGEITSDLVHLADEIYEYIGKVGMEKSVSLHRRYLNVASDNTAIVDDFLRSDAGKLVQDGKSGISNCQLMPQYAQSHSVLP